MLKQMAVVIAVLAFWVTGAYAAGHWEWVPFEEGVPEGTEPEAQVI